LLPLLLHAARLSRPVTTYIYIEFYVGIIVRARVTSWRQQNLKVQTRVTKSHHCTTSWYCSIQLLSSQSISLRTILMLSYRLFFPPSLPGFILREIFRQTSVLITRPIRPN
jgi:hypothetical protein